MKPLNRDAMGVLEAAVREAADEPSAADKLRVRRTLAARLTLAAGASAGAMGLSTAQAAKLAVLTKVILPLATVGTLTTAGVYYHYRAPQRTELSSIEPSTTQGSVSHPSDAPIQRPKNPSFDAAENLVLESAHDDVRHGATGNTGPFKAKAASQAEPVPTKGTLEAETRLLRQTHADIREGRPEQALARLREYDRQFGQGTMRAEHQAARVLALCQLGKRQESRAEAERFLERWPNSPLAPRVRAACTDR